MDIIERGTGDPLVLIPGLQGRWDFMEPTVEALSESFRVLTFSLCDEPEPGDASGHGQGVDRFAAQAEAVLDDRRLERAAICGVSFGGFVALRVAARMPARVSALVLASTPGPYWHLRRRHRLYARLPSIFGPVFAAESPWRLGREIRTALSTRHERRLFVRAQLRTLRRAPVSFARMAARARDMESYDRVSDCALVSCPTLIIHGEPALDHVVDAGGTSQYAQLIRDARVIQLDRTGHLGSITRPREFASAVRAFLNAPRQNSRISAA
jgi:pimeloyl-ACP methyl ester carboxylesterase